jgi:hypothetical protein
MERRGRIEEPGRGTDRGYRDRSLARPLRGIAAGALLALVLANGACYHYVPVSPGTVASDEEVRVRITKKAAGRLVDDLGVYSTEIDGKVSSSGADSLEVAVPMTREYRGVTMDSTTQLLMLGKSEVVEVRRSELSRGRTILASAGVVAGFALLVHAIVQLTNPNPGKDYTLPPPPPPNGSRAPSRHHLQIRIPFP